MEEVVDALEDALVCLARATRRVEELPHSERRALMYTMIDNQAKVLIVILELARQAQEEIGSAVQPEP